ncbi:hypothetical protein Aspvir_003727 [Aspergillus viridinutans]|uniref:Fungal lipase-type domain-containing protein n=1 Tax=Aspergillus viridinutans TaxID=75553 RepID=A0A9P3F351_ASPVI|nr:uncharacterized protein Aspvir_003727 [Aspergillus viridinutans]GIJ99725.1 hypothetical protein Aspvir_003727 [Aspergillus viridinutans]
MKQSFAKKVVSSFIRKKSSRTAAEASAESSASVADVSQSNHSAATSRNLRELSVRLDEYLEQIDMSGGEVDVDVISMSRQVEKISRYTNGSLPASVKPAAISDDRASLIRIAAWASKEVYSSDTAVMGRISRPEQFSAYQPTKHSVEIDASFRDGTVKATRMHLFSSAGSRLLVVAIRGSTSIRRDWTINFDDIGKETDGNGYINVDETEYKVHGGFLECAKAMVDKVSNAISSVLLDAGVHEAEDEDVQLLFTGHSAGGAVASLLYAHMSSKNPSSLSQLGSKFAVTHCITFGSPPVTAPALSASHSQSVFHAIINEGDPVPRLDKDYAESLLQLYLLPMAPKPVDWKLPAMLLENAGTVLLLKNGVEGFCEVPDDEIRSVLESTIFGSPRAHKMDMYLWKLGMMQFN